MAKQKYRVTSTHPVYEHPPGSVFEADLDESTVTYLVDAGHIEKVRADAKVADAKPTTTTEGR